MPGPRKARGKQLPGKIRDAFDLALRNLASGKRGTIIELADIFEEMIITDPLKAFDTIAKFCPKEMLIEQETTHRIISGEPISVDQWEATYLAGPAVEPKH